MSFLQKIILLKQLNDSHQFVPEYLKFPKLPLFPNALSHEKQTGLFSTLLTPKNKYNHLNESYLLNE